MDQEDALDLVDEEGGSRDRSSSPEIPIQSYGFGKHKKSTSTTPSRARFAKTPPTTSSFYGKKRKSLQRTKSPSGLTAQKSSGPKLFTETDSGDDEGG